MTVNELSKAVGKTALFQAGTLHFTCYVLDARFSYGKPQFLIRPVAGDGERWVEISSLVPNKLDTSRPFMCQNNQVGLVRRM
jgi:hypothetical protein